MTTKIQNKKYSKFIDAVPTSHSLYYLVENDPDTADGILDLILENDDLFLHYITNIDQLGVFVSTFKYRQDEILSRVLIFPTASELISDTDAFIRLLALFQLPKQQHWIAEVFTSNETLFKKILPDEDTLRIVERYLPAYFLADLYKIYNHPPEEIVKIAIETTHFRLLDLLQNVLQRKQQCQLLGAGETDRLMATIQQYQTDKNENLDAAVAVSLEELKKVLLAKIPSLFNLCLNFFSTPKSSGTDLSPLPDPLRTAITNRRFIAK
ncbi:hypothetical protein [Aquicella lusitana]|uniref:DUF4123 domain-containing protein n=1 Tax=Aquicella lusitana TaxID=254246 RepID=A0A370GZH8_9COXI|nr:hypothetical protein [Aquicella lusitana]RDI48074.1 hypothetical protein C8D86_10339 [Aquicella lusitana]VVC72910.1 hypothetical protein AQULUS_06340 [Aquicella lusitana]